MTAYYNEIDPFCAEWLRNLIAAGHIAPGDVVRLELGLPLDALLVLTSWRRLEESDG